MLFILLAIIGFLVHYVYVYTKQNRTLPNIPGPKRDILLTHFFGFKMKPVQEYLEIINKWLQDHGSVIKAYDGPLNVGVITKDVKLLEYIYSSNKLIDKAKRYDVFLNWLGTGLLINTGKEWKQRRKLLTPAFHFSTLISSLKTFDKVGNTFVDVLKEHVNKPSVDISGAVSHCTLDFISEAAMGVTLNSQIKKSSPYIQSVKTASEILGRRLFSGIHPLLYKFTLTHYKEMLEVKKIHKHTENIIKQRIVEKEQNGDSSENKKPVFLDILLDSTVDGKALPLWDIRQEVDTFMFEGHDTTAATVNYAMYSLANNPEIQKEAYIEQQTIFGDYKSKDATTTELNEMKYLDLVVKETLRLYPPIPYIGRKLSEDVMYNGMLLPKGLDVMLFTYAVHRDPDNFPDPLTFNPRRFEDMRIANPYMYTPFSAGPRNCIGQKFAMMAIKSILSKVIRHFELLPSTPKHELQLVPYITLKSKNGVCISLKNRI